jgi:hypothetical protein
VDRPLRRRPIGDRTASTPHSDWTAPTKRCGGRLTGCRSRGAAPRRAVAYCGSVPRPNCRWAPQGGPGSSCTRRVSSATGVAATPGGRSASVLIHPPVARVVDYNQRVSVRHLAAPTDSETCAASAGRAYSVGAPAPRAVTEIVVRSVTVIEKAGALPRSFRRSPCNRVRGMLTMTLRLLNGTPSSTCPMGAQPTCCSRRAAWWGLPSSRRRRLPGEGGGLPLDRGGVAARCRTGRPPGLALPCRRSPKRGTGRPGVELSLHRRCSRPTPRDTCCLRTSQATPSPLYDARME